MNKLVTFLGLKMALIQAGVVVYSRRFVVQGTTVYTPFLPLIIASICISLFLVPTVIADEPEDPGAIVMLPVELDPANLILLQVVYSGSVVAGPTGGTLSVLDAQAQYFAAHGHYCQLLPSHSDLPHAGDLAPADALPGHPSDQAESWMDINLYVPEAIDLRLRVDVYESPAGHGYVVVAETRITETVWIRSINVGPETWRSASWEMINLEPPQ